MKAPSVLRAEHAIVLLNVALYATCYMAQVPVLPYLTKHLGADVAAYGRLQTVFSIIQTVGGLVSGPFVDTFGGKLLFLASFAASAASYALTALSSNTALLYASRLPTLLQHAVLAARVMISLRSSDQDRAALLGYIGLAYGLGVVIGPALGGQASRISVYAPSWFAVAGSLLSCLLIVCFLPDDQPVAATQAHAKGADDAKEHPEKERKQLQLADLAQVLSVKGVPDLLCIKAIFAVAFGIFQATFPLVLQDSFGLSAIQNGNVMSYVGLLGVFVQGFAISWLTHRYSESAIVRASCWGLLLSLAALTCARSVAHLLLVLAPLTLFGLLIGTINTSQLTKAVTPDLTGSVVAVDMSLGSLARTVTPLAGTWLMGAFGFPSIGTSAAGCLALVVLLIECGVVQSAPHAKAKYG